ncbi:MAG: hypothetical protein QGI32_10105 [Candidatus Latescibacteria bacterium]|nr:hypothetical protein [Candidatus Latescibacterota bacterium]
MQVRYGSGRGVLMVVAIGVTMAAGCGHFLVPTAFRPVGTGDQIRHSEGTSMEVSDDGTVAWIQGRLEISVRAITDQELNRQFPAFSEDGHGPSDELPTNVFTYGDWEDPRSNQPPTRFSVFKISVKNYEYPKVKFDSLTPTIEASNGRVYFPWGQFDFEEFFRRFSLAYNGLGYMRFRERLSLLKLGLYPDNDFCFSGQEFEGYIVFDKMHDDVEDIVFRIPAVGIRYDYRDQPLETVSLAYKFERDLIKVSRRDQIANAE